MKPEFLAALRAHDEAVRRRGLDIWVGGEPTFTDRHNFEPAWGAAALGGDKYERAARVLVERARRRPGAALLRPLGRAYPGEEAPRWCLALCGRRDGEPVWTGPPDPLWAPPRGEARLEPLRAALPAGVGCGLFSFDGCDVARIDLPAAERAEDYLALLAQVAWACQAAGLTNVVLAGEPPPADPRLAFDSLTPDPGVLEFNLAPANGCEGLYAALEECHQDARGAGLEAERLYYNGDVADSGGGGHITLGGPRPEESVFLRVPRLLPRLLAYFLRHPALSYFFCEQPGSSSQAPRVDEGARESFGELRLALARLTRAERPSPEETWRSLAPFLADRFGNTHRSEINVEKLWNPYLPRRGRLGLVEFRALRMCARPEVGAALAALLRALVAHLATSRASVETSTGDFDPAPRRGTEPRLTEDETLVDWGAELHDRFALPFYLRRDLESVLTDLCRGGWGLDSPIAGALLDDHDRRRRIATAAWAGEELELRRALEFFPLVGDLSAQTGSSRLIDPSAVRIEILLRSRTPEDWTLIVDGRRLPWHLDKDPRGPVAVMGLRYRSFVPDLGLQPLVPAHGPLEILVVHPRRAGRRLRLYDWRPDGQAYDGLPSDADEAARRRRERVTIEECSPLLPSAVPPAPVEALTPYSFDTRWLDR